MTWRDFYRHDGQRDATMVLVAYRHGLRAAELVTLRWDAVDFAHGRVHVHRVKGSAEFARCARHIGIFRLAQCPMRAHIRDSRTRKGWWV